MSDDNQRLDELLDELPGTDPLSPVNTGTDDVNPLELFNEPETHLVTITPAQAQEWLSLSWDAQRALSDDRVNLLAGAMARGEWNLNGETIKFLRNGKMFDGQHRLTAVVRSGATIESYVVFGLELSAVDTVDRGRPRTLSDILKMHGERNQTCLASTLNRLHAWSLGETAMRSPNRFQVTTTQALSMLESDPLIRDSSAFGIRVRSHERIVPESLVAACYHVFRRIDQDDAEDFWLRVNTGMAGTDDEGNPIGMAANHPARKLRSALIKNKTSRMKSPMYTLYGLTIKAWNAYRDGKTIESLSFRAGGFSPERFPEAR